MKLLVAIDLSESSQKVVEQAKTLAKALSAKIWLLHVADVDFVQIVGSEAMSFAGDPAMASFALDSIEIRDVVANKLKDEHRHLQQLSQEFRSMGINCYARLAQGPKVETILQEADKLSVDMVILGSHGKGIVDRLLIGSISEGVLHKSSVPVLIIPTQDRA